MSIAIFGVGAMGEALLRGWLQSGWEAAQLLVNDAAPGRAAEVAAKYGVRDAQLTELAAADVIVVAVKPHQIEALLSDIGAELRPTTLVVSIAAGIGLARLQAALPEGQPVVRVMPNTPALVGQGMAGIAAAPSATPEHVATAQQLCDAVGRSLVVSESALDAVTAVSGSGPAYVFYLAEAMIEAGVHQGLTRDQATMLVEQTLLGSATLLASSDADAGSLRQQVTSPAGTTAAGLRVLDDQAVRAAVLRAVEAAANRSRELG